MWRPMDNTDPTDNGTSSAEVIVAEETNDALVIGGDSALAEFVAQWEAEGPQSHTRPKSPVRS